MNQKETTSHVLIGVSHVIAQFVLALALALVAGSLYLSLSRVDRFLNLKAQQDCATSYKLEFIDKSSNTTITRPIDDLYRKCLTEKGV